MSNPEDAVDEMAKKIADALRSNQEKATQPMKSEITEEKKASYKKLVSHPKPKTEIKKTLEGFKTHTLLDTLYLDVNEKQIDGIPKVVQLGITGLPSSGKSVLVRQIAVQVANEGIDVLLVTNEDSFDVDNQRMDLQTRLKQTADILGLDWNKISAHLTILDTITHSDLRNWSIFAEVYRIVVEEVGIKLVLVDSVTLLDTYRGALKVRLQELTTYNQVHGITAIYVNQRATEDWDARAMAGGIGLGHILDSTVIIDYGVPSSWKRQMKQDFRELGIEVKQGDSHKFVRVLGCRLCGFNGKYQPIMITPNGLLRILEPEEKKE